MVWVAAGHEIWLNSSFAPFDSAYVMAMVMAGTEPMTIVGKGLGAIVDPAARAADRYAVNNDDM